MIMKNKIVSHLPSGSAWGKNLYWLESIDSTNNYAKKLAREGAPHGTVVGADYQSAGRGRLGRSFLSPAGEGLYLSVILRPALLPEEMMDLTCVAAVAACRAVEEAAGILPGIKWTNDLVVDNKKLGGILTELSIKDDMVEYAVIGIGINCLQTQFPPELKDMAVSLKMLLSRPVQRERLAAAIIENLLRPIADKKAVMDAYRKNCVTIGREISLLQGDRVFHGTALDVAEDGSLLVRMADGKVKTVVSGEVSVRGMYGYL